MNGKRARAIRKQVYGERTYRDRQYNLILSSSVKQRVTIRADVFRENYQREKNFRTPLIGSHVKRNRLGKTYSQMVEIWRKKYGWN